MKNDTHETRKMKNTDFANLLTVIASMPLTPFSCFRPVLCVISVMALLA
jgi:hypothetical protein